MKEHSTQVIAILHDVTRQWKVVLLIPLFCLITIAIFLLVTPPANGYEYSIYTAYPLIFWVVAGLLFLFPLIYIYISHIKHTAIPFSKKSIYGLLIIAVVNLVLLLHIPKARGYLTFSSGDTLTHIGFCVDILNSGHMLTQNPYPLSHIGISITSQLTGITPQTLSLSTVGVVAILFILGIIVLSRSLRFTTLQTVSVTAFAIVPILGFWLTIEEIMPSTIGWAFIPLFLMISSYLLVSRTHTLQYTICWLLLCAAMCFYHPEAVLFPTIMIVVILGFCILWNLLHKDKQRRYRIHYVPIIPLIIVFVAGFLLFFLNTNDGGIQLSTYTDIAHSMFSPTDNITETTMPLNITETTIPLNITDTTMPLNPYLETYPLWKTQKMSSLCTSFFEGGISLRILISSFLTKLVAFGMVYWNLLILSALCLLTSVWYIASKKFRSLDKRYLVILILFFIFVGISIICVMIYPDMWSIHRVYKYPVIFGIFILGILFSDCICSINKSKIRRILSILSIISIIFMLIFSMTSLYRSPGIGESSYQITNEDVEAMHLIYEYRNTDFLLEESGRQHQFRYNSYIYGQVYGEKQHKNIRGIDDMSIYPPSNFGYYQHTALGQSYENTTYYLKTPPYGEFKRWFLNNLEYWPLGGIDDFGTLPSSWKHLSYDSSVNKFLDGNAIEAYLIHPVVVK